MAAGEMVTSSDEERRPWGPRRAPVPQMLPRRPQMPPDLLLPSGQICQALMPSAPPMESDEESDEALPHGPPPLPPVGERPRGVRRPAAFRPSAARPAWRRSERSGWSTWRPQVAALLATACAAFAVFVDASIVVAVTELEAEAQPPPPPLPPPPPPPPPAPAGVYASAFLGFGPREAWFHSLVALGATVASVPVGLLSERIGRKLIIFVMGALCCLSWPLVIVIRKNVDVLYAARFIAGMSLGASCVLHPMYVSEIADDRQRGALCMLLPLVTSFTYLLTAVAARFLSPMWTMTAPGLFPLVLLIAFAKMPESPQYLLNIGFDKESDRAVRWLQGRRNSSSSSVDPETQSLRAEDGTVSIVSNQCRSTDGRPQNPALRTCVCRPYPIFVGFSVLLLRPLTGSMTMRYFMEACLSTLLHQNLMPYSQLIVGLFELAGIMLGTVSVDHIGRHPLLLTSSIGSVICYALLGYYFNQTTEYDPNIFVTILAALFLVYGFGVGSVPWVMLSEVIPNHQKGWATGIVLFFHWLVTFILVNGFPLLVACGLESSIFIAFSIISIIAIVIVCKFTVETKKKNLDDIQKELEDMHSGKCSSNINE